MKKAYKKLLKRMRLTPDEATQIACRFVREQYGRDLPPEGPVKIDPIRSATWRAIFNSFDPTTGFLMDPNLVIVLIDDASGQPSFFPVL